MSRLTAHDVVTVHRLEFPFWINTACQAVWGACFAVASVRGLFELPVLLAVAANFLILMAGLLLNTAVDIPSDTRHAERGHLADSALRLGRNRGVRLAVAELVAGLFLASVISLGTGRWLVVLAAVAAALLHLLYNVEPVHLKRRGFPGAVAFAAAAIGLPCVLSYTAVRSDFDTPVSLIFAGLTVLAIGRVAWWSVPDLEADDAAGLATPAVRYGAVSTLAASCVIMLAGLVLLAWGFRSGYGAVAAVFGTAAHLAFLTAALVLLRRVLAGVRPRSRKLQKQAMPLVMVGDLIVVAIPLFSG